MTLSLTRKHGCIAGFFGCDIIERLEMPERLKRLYVIFAK